MYLAYAYMYMNMNITTIKETEAINLKEQGLGTWEVLEKEKGIETGVIIL